MGNKLSDKLDIGKFYPDLPPVKLEEVLTERIMLHEAKIVKDYKGDYGIHDFCLLRFSRPGDKAPQDYTTLCGGSVVVDQVKRLQEMGNKGFPVECQIKKVSSEGSNQYYTLADWEDAPPPEKKPQ